MNPIPYSQMAPVAHLSADLFLIGFIAGCSLVAGLFFLRFWRKTGDSLFLGFAAFFFIQGGTFVAVVDLPHPNLGSTAVFLLRLIGTLAVLAAILAKNAGKA